MPNAKILRIYLDEVPLARAEKGNFNLINRVRAAFEGRGFRVELRKNSEAERLKSATRRGYSLFHMDDPFHGRALTLRRAYYYPFWRIESSAKRWEWEIAQTPFDPDAIDPAEAAKFGDFWRKKLFGGIQNAGTSPGTVYIPLQGRLLEQRSFQSLSPVAMIEAVLRQDTERLIQVAFHPGETYLQEEIDAVRAVVDRQPRVTISSEPMARLLARCDYVATENSSVALAGYFFHKPAALFARIDFHHIAASVPHSTVQDALAAVPDLNPEYDRYLYWFLKQTTINGGSDQAEAQILHAVRHRGWDV